VRIKKVILLSPSTPSQNPRLLKEYFALKNANYDVKVLYGVRDTWSEKITNYNADFMCTGGRHHSLLYLFTRLLNKISIFILPVPLRYDRISLFLFLKAKSMKADLYIAHNLAALPIAVKAAKYNGAKAGFDAEDFHRQEVTDDIKAPEYKLVKYLEDKYLPQANYVTAASPLIAKAYKELYPKQDFTVINNAFSSSLQPKNIAGCQAGKLKLFWFSQTVGKKRGIELIYEAMGLLSDIDVQLTLVGNCSVEMKDYLFQLSEKFAVNIDRIVCLPPMSEKALFDFAAKQDIGLALEPGFCLNNHIALSNKLFTYLTVGLAVVATNTKAQREFMLQNPGIGKSFNIGDVEALADIIRSYSGNKEALINAKQAAYNLGKDHLNWENEGKKFIEIIQSTI
jgi:glycosyltransferase involved in cell wall biosynthesis